MIKEININDTKIKYELNIKKVKNINLRIKPDGRILVSANKYVSKKIIEEFLISKSDFIFNALYKYKNIDNTVQIEYFDKQEVQDVILSLCEKHYPYFEKMGIEYPVIKFKKMISRWGSCNFQKGILTFSLYLSYAPVECIEYVVLHEFTHFLVPNHSKDFYTELEKVCPDWKDCRKKLKHIVLKGK